MSIVPPGQLHHRVIPPSRAQNRPPLVLLHGLMGFAANWGKVWPQFTDRPVLVLDQRGHGRSAKPATGYDPSDYARDLAALLDHLGWSRSHIVGHSMGGRVALRFCALFPERALSLCMEDSGVEANPSRIDWIRGLLDSVPTPFSSRESAKAHFTENFLEDPLTGSFLHANLETKANGNLDWRFHAPGMIETVERGRATDALEEFRQLAQPILLIRGGRSREFPKAEAERMLVARPATQLVTMEGAGHYVHAEKPGEFCEALANFIGAVDAAN